MRKYFFTLLLSLLVPLTLFSQAKYSITGTVADSSGKKVVEFATIAVQSLKDSSIIASGITDMKGSFEVKNVPQGRYNLKISHMSYNPYSKLISVRGDLRQVKMGVVKLTVKDLTIEEVVVTGKSTPVRIAKDTVEFNTNAYKPRENDVVEDVLKKLPGVSVDKDGGITVNGKSVTQIMVDGKRFFMNDPKLATQNLPADIIDRIQLVDKKSDQAEFTKIDDGETEKVINLTLKKDKRKGYFGNVRGGYGTDDRYDLGLRAGGFKGTTQLFAMGSYNNINRGGRGGSFEFPNANRQGLNTSGNGAVNLNIEPNENMTVNGNYRFNYGNSIKEQQFNRQNFDEKGTYLSDRNTDSDGSTYGHGFYSRIEYKFDTTLSMVLSPNFQISKGNSFEKRNAHEYGYDKSLVNSEKSESESNSESLGYGVDLLVRKSFKKPRQTLSLYSSLKMNDSNSDGITKQDNFYANLNQLIKRNQSVVSDGIGNSFNSRATFTNPISKNLTGELNYKFAYGYNKNTTETYDYNDAAQAYDVYNSEYSRNNRNKRINNAVGAMLNFSKSKFVASFGGDINLTNLDYLNQRGSALIDTVVNYSSFAPMVNISFAPSESSDLMLNYRSSSKQPTVEQIRPLPNPNTPNMVYLGNDALKQERQHSFTFNYNYFNKQSFLSFNNYSLYNFTQDAIQTQSYRDDLGKTYNRAINLKGLYSLSNYTTIGKSILNNKLHLSNSASVSYSHVPGMLTDAKFFSNQLQYGDAIRAYMMLTFLEVGADLSWNTSMASYEGLTGSAADAKKSTKYSTLTLSGNATAFLPAGLELKSTYELSNKYGEMASNADKSMLWNASVTKKFLKDKSLSLSFIAFDILNQYRPFSRNITANYIEESTYNTISQTFMLTLSYTLNRFGGMRMPGGGGRGGSNRPRGDGPGHMMHPSPVF